MGGLYYKVHGLRLAQAREMQLDLKADRPHGRGRPAMIHMQLDGEPWQQELPSDETEPPLHVNTAQPCQIIWPLMLLMYKVITYVRFGRRLLLALSTLPCILPICKHKQLCAVSCW